MTITKIEKAAKLMGYEVESVSESGVWIIEHDKPLNRDGEHPIRLFNPYTNKADLMDVECALGINIRWEDGFVVAKKVAIAEYGFFNTDTDKFTARAKAVMAVVEQIYDSKF